MRTSPRALTVVNDHLPTCCAPEVPPPPVDAETLVRAFRALGDVTRLDIVRRLRRAPEVCVCHLAEGFPVGQATVSHHLKVLREAGLVDFRKRGTWAYYYLREDLPEPIRITLAAIEGETSDVGSTPRH